MRLTGSVPLADEEFATIADGAALNGAVTILVVLLILWLALKQTRIMLAVLINLAIGLSFTAAIGLRMVGALNLISVAFAVLFIGLGVDFGIQFSVRYRAERFADRDLLEALETTGRRVAAPLLLAAASIAAAFYSFLPTAYVGLSELGLIAGTGMIVAFVTTVTLLPALLSVLKPAGEAAPVGWAWLAPLDHFLDKRRNWVVGLTLAAVVLGLPLLRGLSFDFNPLNLRSRHVEFGLDPPRSDARSGHEPQHHRCSRARSRQRFGDGGKAQASCRRSPKCGRWKASCPRIRMRSWRSSTTPASSSRIRSIPIPSTPRRPRPKHWRRSTRRRLIFRPRPVTWTAPAAAQARRLANALTALAKASPATRDEAERVLVTPLMTMLRQVRELLTAEHVTIDTLPPSLKSAWVAADGEVRIEARPSGDGNDNAVLHRFVDAVRKVAPQASGGPVFIVEAAATIVKAFLEAAVWSLSVDRADPVRGAEALAGCRADARAFACRHNRHARDLRGDRAQAEFRQHHRAAAFAGRRRRVQNLLRHGVAGGRAQFFAIEPDAGGLLQRLHHRHRLRQPVVFPPSWHLEHGQADGPVAGDDPFRGGIVPARPAGDAEQVPCRGMTGGPLTHNWTALWQKGDSRRRPALLA